MVVCLVLLTSFFAVIQTEIAEPAPWQKRGVCGVNAAFLLLRCSNRNVTFDNVLSKTVFSPESGSSISEVCMACNTLGLKSKIVNATAHEIFREYSPPFIAHFDDTQYGGSGHFVVAIGYENGGIRIADGGTCQVTTISTEEFSRLASGYYVVPETNDERPSIANWALIGIGLGIGMFPIVQRRRVGSK